MLKHSKLVCLSDARELSLIVAGDDKSVFPLTTTWLWYSKLVRLSHLGFVVQFI